MAEPAPRAEAAPISAPSRGFPWYVAGVATWFGAFGMQQVLFSWLVVGELHAEARWVGVAQSASMRRAGRRSGPASGVAAARVGAENDLPRRSYACRLDHPNDLIVQEIGHLADLWGHSSDPNNVTAERPGGTPKGARAIGSNGSR